MALLVWKHGCTLLPQSNHIYIQYENKRNIGISVSLLNVFSLLKLILNTHTHIYAFFTLNDKQKI